jgi:hypothetical protein
VISWGCALSGPSLPRRAAYFGPDRWSVAFFTYSHERYEPSFFASGEQVGTPEEGLDVGAVYLTGMKLRAIGSRIRKARTTSVAARSSHRVMPSSLAQMGEGEVHPNL